MRRIRKLVVKGQNLMVNRIKFLTKGQERVNVIPHKSAINNVQYYSDVSIPVSVASISHHVYNGSKWVKQAVENHPVVTNLHLELDKSGYKQFGKTILTHPK